MELSSSFTNGIAAYNSKMLPKIPSILFPGSLKIQCFLFPSRVNSTLEYNLSQLVLVSGAILSWILPDTFCYMGTHSGSGLAEVCLVAQKLSLNPIITLHQGGRVLPAPAAGAASGVEKVEVLIGPSLWSVECHPADV